MCQYDASAAMAATTNAPASEATRLARALYAAAWVRWLGDRDPAVVKRHAAESAELIRPLVTDERPEYADLLKGAQQLRTGSGGSKA